MKNTTLLVLLFAVNTVVFSQNNSISDFFISNIDSLISKQLIFQEQTRDPETVVFLKDSMINYFFDDQVLPCENQPTISNYTYNINGLVTLLESRDTPEEGCNPNKRQDIFTYEEANITSHLVKYYDIDTNQWVNYTKQNYQYDTNNNEIETTRYLWDTTTSNWLKKIKWLSTYNGDLLLVEKTYTWIISNNDWFLKHEDIYSYNTNNLILEFVYNSLNETNNTWETLRKKTYLYDASSSIIEYVDYRKYTNEVVYEWNTILKHNYSYDTDNQLIEDLYYGNWNNEINDWESFFKHSYDNDNLGNPIQIETFKWDYVLEVWQNKNYITIAYNSNQLITQELNQNWVIANSDWENHSLRTFTYDEYFKLLQNKLEYWDPPASWYNGTDSVYEYDEYQNLIHYHGYGDLYGWDYYYYYSEYDIVLGNNDILLKDYIFIYPNPSNDSITINGLENEADIIIYDVSGKKVLETTTVNTIDISSLDKGMYFVAIQQGAIRKNIKLVKN